MKSRKLLLIVISIMVSTMLILSACAQQASEPEEPAAEQEAEVEAPAEEEPAESEESEPTEPAEPDESEPEESEPEESEPEEAESEEEPAEEASGDDGVVVAFSGPLTGSFAEEGEIEVAGFELAVADWNEQGGVLGQEVVPFICDDQVEVESGVACAQQAVERGATAVTGFFFSNVGIAARPTYTQNDIIFAPSGITAIEVVSTAENPELVFRTIGLSNEVAGLTAKFMLEDLGLRQLFVLHDRDAWGRDQAVIVQEHFEEHPEAEVLGFEGVTVGESEFSGLVTTIIASGADSVYFGGHHIEQAAIINQLRDAGWEGVYTGPDSLKIGYPELAGANAEGSVFCEGAGPETIEAGQEWSARFEEEFGFPPRHYSAATYVAIDLVLRAVAELGSAEDPVALTEWIRGNTHETVMGNISFDENGEVIGFPWICLEYQGDEWATVANYDAEADDFVHTDAFSE